MTLRKPLLLLAAAAPLLWAGYGWWSGIGIPRVEVRSATPLPSSEEQSLPFFELMSPLPSLKESQALPKLEYKKGPPDRFLERITVLFQSGPLAAKERVVYYGRQSRTDLRGIGAFPDDPAREARYIETAIRLSQGEPTPQLSALAAFLYRPFLLGEAAQLLEGASSVTIMDQAGTPAFLVERAPDPDGRASATALFARRNGFYRVDFLGDRGFALVDPLSVFRKSFLTGKRADALEYVSRKLADVRLRKEAAGSIREISWPVLLLAAHVSVDPSSLDTFFHFAGLNALLYRSVAGRDRDIEISDVLRNNVLASDRYARDIAPEAAKTAEIARFARLLTRNFSQ